MSRQVTLDVFFSYAREDSELRERLENHLALLRRRQAIRTWHDGEITAGDKRDPELFRHLETADVVLLLVSPEFIASGLESGQPTPLTPDDWQEIRKEVQTRLARKLEPGG